MKQFPNSPHVQLTEEVVFPFFQVRVPEDYEEYNAALVDLFDLANDGHTKHHYRVMCKTMATDVVVPAFYSATYLLESDIYYRCHITLMKHADSTTVMDTLTEMELDYDC